MNVQEYKLLAAPIEELEAQVNQLIKAGDRLPLGVGAGSCAVLAAIEVEEIERVEWLDLGMPEALWVSRVKEFGPLIISIDAKGNNLFETNKAGFNAKKGPIVEEISRQVRFIK